MKIKVEVDTDNIFGEDSEEDIKHEIINRVSEMILNKMIYTTHGKEQIQKKILEKMEPGLNEIRVKIKESIIEALNKTNVV